MSTVSEGAVSQLERQDRRGFIGILGIAAGGLLIAGSLEPWVTANAAVRGSISRSGIDRGDGHITLVAGVIACVLGLLVVGGPGRRRVLLALLISAALASEVIAAADYLVVPRVGAGIWMVNVGSALLLVAATVGFAMKGTPTAVERSAFPVPAPIPVIVQRPDGLFECPWCCSNQFEAIGSSERKALGLASSHAPTDELRCLGCDRIYRRRPPMDEAGAMSIPATSYA